MKGFTRMETRFSLCGLNCDLCSMHLGGYCPGCGGGAGNQSCTMAKCSLEHGGIQFCWECREYPCPRYDGIDDWDSFVPHRSRQQDIAKVRELGLEAYLAQLGEKRAILDSLLARFNDGRRKTLFNTAVYLLPLEDLQSVMADLNSRTELAGQSVKERALAAVELVQQAADRRVRGVDGDIDGGDVQVADPLELPAAEVGQGDVIAHEKGQPGIVILKI